MTTARSGSRLTLDGVCVTLAGQAVLHDVSFTLEPGEAVALVGLSGAGKTTLLRTCNGMVMPERGSVRLGNHDLATLSPTALRRTRLGIGLIHQDLGLVGNLRVIQNVVSGRLGRRSLLGGARDLLIPARAVVRRVYEILESVGIPDKLYVRTDRLSGGEQQRVAIARALFQEPRVLLADEPVASVDPARARRTVALLRDLCAAQELSLCVSLHNLELAMEFFPRLVALRAGRILFDKKRAAVTPADLDALFQLQSETPANPHRATRQQAFGTGVRDRLG